MTQTNENPTPGINLQVSSRLMNDYQPVSSFDIRTEFVISHSMEEGADVELFYIDHNGKTVYNVERDSVSQSGWKQTILVDKLYPRKLHASLDETNHQTLFIIGPSLNSVELYYVKKQGSQWSDLIPIDAQNSGVPDYSYVQTLAAKTIKGKQELFAITCDGPDSPIQNPPMLWRIPWREGDVEWQYLGTVSEPIIEFCNFTAWGEEGVVVLTEAEGSSYSDLIFYPAPFNTAKTLATKLNCTTISAGDKEDGSSGLFLYTSDAIADKSLSYIDCSSPTPTVTVITQDISCRQIRAGHAGHNHPLCLYILDNKNQLRIFRQQENGWGNTPLPLGIELSTMFVGTTIEDYSKVFGVDPTGKLCHVWANPVTAKDPIGDWSLREITIPLQTIKTTNIYATEIKVFDQNGNPLTNLEVELSASELITAKINGLEQTIGPSYSIYCKTISKGTITLTAPTEKLSAALIKLKCPTRLKAHEAYIINPQYFVQNQLKATTEADIANILKGTGYEQKAKDVHAGIQQTINMADHSSLQGKVTFVQNDDGTFHDKINTAILQNNCWKLSITQNDVVYQQLTAEEVQQYYAKLNNIHWNPIKLIGDAINMIKRVITDAIEVICEGAQITIKILCDGMMYIYRGIIETVRAAFHIAESIFNAVKVGFDKLCKFFAWLLEEMSKEIWHVKSYIQEKYFTQGINSFIGLIQYAERESKGFFKKQEENVENYFNQAIQAVGDRRLNPETDLLPLLTGKKPTDAPLIVHDLVTKIQDHMVTANWLTNKFESPSCSVDLNLDLPTSLIDQFTRFFTNLAKTIGDDLQLQIDALLNFFNQIVRRPEDFANLTLKLLLTQIKELVKALIKILDLVVEEFLILIESVVKYLDQVLLKAPIDNFFIKGIYNLLNPTGQIETPTMAQLVSLFCAFPVGVVNTMIGYHLKTDDGFETEFSLPVRPVGVATLTSSGSSESSFIKEGCLFGSAILTFVWTIIDLSLDISSQAQTTEAEEDEAGKGIKFIKFLLNCVPVANNALANPFVQKEFKEIGWNEHRKYAAIIAWGVNFIPSLTGLGLMLGGISLRGSKAGSGVLCFFGLLIAVSNTVKFAMDGKALGFAGGISGSVPLICKPAIIIPEWGLPMVVGADLVGGGLSGTSKLIMSI